MNITKQEEEAALKEGGRKLASIMGELTALVGPGISTDDLNDRSLSLMKSESVRPAFLNYQPEGATRPFPAALCVSINEEIVHGIPNENPRILREGDVVTLDAGLECQGFFTDMAVTVPVGKVDIMTAKLIATAKEALDVAIKTARAGNTTGDIGAMVEAVAKKAGFSTPHELGGHGVGKRVHEEPFIPNFGTSGSGDRLEEGMVIAIEPIIIAGKGGIKLLDDGYTYVSADGTRSAQFEHTVVVRKYGAEVLTHV